MIIDLDLSKETVYFKVGVRVPLTKKSVFVKIPFYLLFKLENCLRSKGPTIERGLPFLTS